MKRFKLLFLTTTLIFSSLLFAAGGGGGSKKEASTPAPLPEKTAPISAGFDQDAWLDKMNENLQKKHSDLSLNIEETTANGYPKITFSLQKKGISDIIANARVWVCCEFKLLTVFTGTHLEFQRKHLNLYLRAVIVHYFYSNITTRGCRLMSEIYNPASGMALRKYFIINEVAKGQSELFYLKLDDNIQIANALLSKYPD
jgi:hypothetical protein